MGSTIYGEQNEYFKNWVNRKWKCIDNNSGGRKPLCAFEERVDFWDFVSDFKNPCRK